MMFCEQCGSEVTGDDKFCPNCGAPVQRENEITGGGYEWQAGGEQPFTPQSDMDEMAKKIGESAQKAGAIAQKGLKNGKDFVTEKIQKTEPKILKKMIAGVVAVFVVLVVVVVVVSNHKHTINLEDYVQVDYEGYQGYGTAVAFFDTDALETEIISNAKVRGLKSKEKKEFKNAKNADDLIDLTVGTYSSDLSQFMVALNECEPECQLSQYEGLSNGDEVILTFDYDNDVFKEYGIKFTGTEKKYTVADLTDAIVYDYFANVDVTFSGISPNVTAEVSRDDNGDVAYYVSYDLSKYYDIKKGETITMTLDVDADDLMREFGYVIQETTKEFSCENVSEYISELAQIPEDTLQKMQDQSEDAFRAHVAQSWEDADTLKKFNFIGCYLLKEKEGYDEGTKNSLYLVYSVKVKSGKKAFTYYYYTQYYNIMLLEDGTCSVDLSDYSTPSDRFEKNDLYYDGYEKLDTMFSKCITSNIESYEYESSVTE
jgi:preprotein translocase subunit SecG